ncbi:MAG TPA: hypothetical protein VGR02_13980 [Thermoanaerobaculia bacterium]|jgi:hypothetical protein|nr:hypothetical protein [Thermoanaerobaculia bacterium]
MAEFDDLRDARQQKEQASQSLVAARDRIRRAEARRTELLRTFDVNNREHTAEQQRIDRELAAAQKSLGEARTLRAAGAALESRLLAALEQQTDPRKAIGRLNDNYPILLFPVRLETRFKGGELLVRVYPDDCSIDTFEPRLSRPEVQSAQLYWSHVFAAGKRVEDERAAWKGLASAHGEGRAEYLIANYRPQDVDARPVKDVVLVIPTEAPLADPERGAVAAYWSSVWLAERNQLAIDAARATLAGIAGPDRAAQVIETYAPFNINAEGAKDPAKVAVAFAVFPRSETLDLREHSWSRPARVTTMPDRFAFIGINPGQNPFTALGAPVPSPLVTGPDPSAPQDEQLQPDANGNLTVPDEMRWMFEFDRALAVGMGFRINLGQANAPNGFQRVLVAGVRAFENEQQSQQLLETLIEHHRFSRGGISLLPQGTPTNNTDTSPSGFTRAPDAEASFDDLGRDSLFDPSPDWRKKQDGQWLADLLGIRPDAVRKLRHADGRDQADARAMNDALWPATLGYWMESMMTPVFDGEAIDRTRDFFRRHVVARGAVPAIRIGKQPYGILPATALSKMQWLSNRRTLQDPSFRFLRELYRILLLMDADWKAMSAAVSFAGKQGGDPHQVLLDILGLHPASVSFSQRYAETLTQLYNRFNLWGFGALVTAQSASLQESGASLLRRLGYAGEKPPEILERVFHSADQALKGPVVDDRPLSETEPIRGYTDDGRNYIRWLIDAAQKSHDELYAQRGFSQDKPPQALLYLMLRHALQLGYHDASTKLHAAAGLLDGDKLQRAKRDDSFMHVAAAEQTSGSRYLLLYAREAALTAGDQTLRVGDFIGKQLATLIHASRLREQLEALQLLEDASTGRLERAFVEHLDLCSYRLDAWLLGLVNFQLAGMRELADGQDKPPRQGIHLGAYAWLEEVRPQARRLSPVRLGGELAAAFGAGAPLNTDSANEGYIHAPSLNQAVAAAVLRAGFSENASPANRETMAVNITSERVRMALAIIEGIRGGQSLGALLGYQFERGLHDRHNVAEVDKFIFDIRGAFPLAGKRLQSTKPPDGTKVDQVEARNVVDGVALVKHVLATGNRQYPFGLPGLEPANAQAERDAINAEVERLLDAHDAVADLALAEGVYQAVIGNQDRAGSTYDAYAKGNFPPEPLVVQTPVSGAGLTHRVALHLDPNAAAGPTPRAQAEPPLNAWLAGVLPPPASVGCIVTYRDAATNAPATVEVTFADLGLAPLDILQLVHGERDQAMGELDDRIARFVVENRSPRPDQRLEISYMKKQAAPLSVFELLPLVRQLRRLLETARPLRPTDMALANEAKEAQDGTLLVDGTRLQAVRDNLLAPLGATLDAVLAALQQPPAQLVAAIDDRIRDLVAALAEAARFGIPESGWGFAYDFRERFFRAILAKAAKVVQTWTGRLDELNRRIAAIPPAASDAEKFDLLYDAERFISTQPTMPQPATPDDLVAAVNAKRDTFVAKLGAFANLPATQRTSVKDFLGDARLLLPTDAFDSTPLTFDDEEKQILFFAEDAARVVAAVRAEVTRRLDASQAALDAAKGDQAAKALLGDDFLVLPTFTLAAAQGDELEKSLGADLLRFLTDTKKIPLPVDTWLYGVARVREPMRAFEQMVMLSGAFGTSEPRLTPLQLPFAPGESWMALEFPPATPLDRDRLLYTASFAAPFAKAAPQCGLLLDEWSEVIPSADVTSGIAFHFDRPNNEAPQTMLLVTPTDFRGEWRWDDLVDALNETLDLAKRRAVEPDHIDRTAYARFIPATIAVTQRFELTIAMNLALNNTLTLAGANP